MRSQTNSFRVNVYVDLFPDNITAYLVTHVYQTYILKSEIPVLNVT